MSAHNTTAAAVETASSAAQAPAPTRVTWGDPARHRILGKRFPRVEGPEKVTGRAKYTYDINLPGFPCRCPASHIPRARSRRAQQWPRRWSQGRRRHPTGLKPSPSLS